jgi:hypothetical protein
MNFWEKFWQVMDSTVPGMLDFIVKGGQALKRYGFLVILYYLYIVILINEGQVLRKFIQENSKIIITVTYDSISCPSASFGVTSSHKYRIIF